MNDIKKFPAEVVEEIGHYVYRLIDPRNGETFYVGRGQRNRVFDHINGLCDESDDSLLNDKLQTINSIKNAGLTVIHVIHRHGMNESEAKIVEAALIDAYPGLTNIQGGTNSGEFGPMNVKELIEKYKTEKAVFEHNILMISLRSGSSISLLDQTRFAWKLSKTKIKHIEYVLAVIKGIIRGVYIPEEWDIASISNFPEFNLDVPTRMAFRGKEAPEDIQRKYVGKGVPEQYKYQKGSSNPIKYSF